LGILIPPDMRAGIDASLLTNTEDDLVGAGTASQRAEQYFNDQLKEEYGTIDPHRALQIKRQRDMLADLNRAAAQGNAEAARLVDANQAAQDREAEARQQAQVDIEALEAQNREREAAVARGEEARRQSMSQADDMIRQIGLTSFEISRYAPTGGQFMAELADKIYRAAIGGDRTAPAKMIQQLREEMEGQGD
jgi:glycine/D-amino acid oxidase-like deaminating enzyme